MAQVFRLTIENEVLQQLLFDMLNGVKGISIEKIIDNTDYEKFINEKIEKSEKDILQGRVFDHTEVKNLIEQWKK